jgi:hypothetical protein
LYTSPDDQGREYGMDEAYSALGEMRNADKILVEKPEKERQIGRYRRRLRYNIKIDLTAKETWTDGVDWIHLALDSDRWLVLVNTVTILRIS